MWLIGVLLDPAINFSDDALYIGLNLFLPKAEEMNAHLFQFILAETVLLGFRFVGRSINFDG